jgi:threonine dehydratase
VLPDAADVARARALLRRHVPVTRLVRSVRLPRVAGSLWLKLESELPTGSFKVRGALYALACAVGRGNVSGVVAASTGNHGAAVAFAARACGVPATIFLPEQPNATKRARILEHGATVVEAGADISGARAAAESFAAAHGAFLLDDATDGDLPAGPATIAVEIFEQLPAARVLLVPMGDTALIRGVASAARRASPGVRVVGVQAAAAPAYANAWRTGSAAPTVDCATIADGLATRIPDPANVAAIRQVVDDVVLVTERQLLDAMRELLICEQVYAEPAGAAAVAAALYACEPTTGSVALVTGSNASAQVLATLLGGGAPPAHP